MRRVGAKGPGVVVRREATEQAVSGAAVRLAGARGSLLVLVVGGDSTLQDLRVTLTR